MNEIKIFSNPQFGEIRTAIGENGEPMFCLPDLCRVLDLTPSKVAQRLSEDVLSKYPLETAGGIQQTNFVNEDGLYDAILDSRKSEARKFRKWVTSEVLPTIRKHGVYATPQTIDNLLADPDNAIKVFQTLKEERQLRQIAEAKIKEDAPKVLFADAVVGSKSTCLIGELAKIISQNGYPIGQNRLFQWMRDNGYLGKHGERYNIPNQQYVEMGLFELKKGVRSGKGQSYFINKFLHQ